MKIKHLFLGLAMVALMAACTKNAETTSPTTEATPTEEPAAAEVTPAVEQVEEPVKEEAPVKKEAKKETAKKETAKPATPQADPCEAAVKAYEKYADQVADAKKHKDTPDGLTVFVKLKKQADAQRATIKDCASNPEYKTRVANAIRRVTNATM